MADAVTIVFEPDFDGHQIAFPDTTSIYDVKQAFARDLQTSDGIALSYKGAASMAAARAAIFSSLTLFRACRQRSSGRQHLERVWY